jgi:hypothetical protein
MRGLRREEFFMRLLYATVVISLVSMILIGSYLYVPAGMKSAMTPYSAENARENKTIAKRTDALYNLVMKYKTDMEKFLHIKKT